VADPAAVLDVGCGTGALLRLLAERLPATADLWGVDPAPAMIELGRAPLGERSNVQLEVAFAEELPYPEARFDLVVSTVSLHHWADQAAGLGEVGRDVERLLRSARLEPCEWARIFDLGRLPLIQAVIARRTA